MKNIFILGFAILIQLFGIAIAQNELKNADGFYKQGDYYNAIVNYEIYLGIRKPITEFSPYTLKRKKAIVVDESTAAAVNTIGSSKLVTKSIAWKLGESYRLLYHFQRAEPCYSRLVSAGYDNNYPLARYWYGVCLRSNNKIDEAEKQFKTFLNENGKNVASTSLATKELETIAFVRKQTRKTDETLTIGKLKGNVSQAEGAYAPIVFKDTMVFTSARIVDTVNKYSSTNSHVNHLFYNTIANSNEVTGNATIVHFPSKISDNEGTPAITPDKSKLYFARSKSENGKTISSIYVSNRTKDGTWSEPEKLNAKINQPDHNSIQPSISLDNKFFLFSSDRDGGIGKFDIWCSQIDASGNLGEPFNLKSINTKEDEQAPFYHTNSKTLVFASKGYLGMGGFDLFSAKGDLLHLQTPINLGSPINSTKDDIYFFSASNDSLIKKSYVSSDRASDCCLELFALNKTYPVKHKQSLVGTITDCASNSLLDAAKVSVSNTPNNYSLVTNQDGTFNVATVDSVTEFEISKDGYVSKTVPFYVADKLTRDTVYQLSACLSKIPPPPPPPVKKDTVVPVVEKPLIVYFDFNKSDVKEEYYPVLDQVIGKFAKDNSKSMLLDINGYTDAKGTDIYNNRLGLKRAESCKKYLVSKGVSAKQLSVKSFGKTAPVAADSTPDNKDNPEGRALNRRVEMQIK